MTTQNAAATEADQLVDSELGYQIQAFYFNEAELLDEQRFADWLEVFDEDLTYWAPLHTNRLRRQAALSIGKPGEAAYFDETKESLAWRIRRYDSGMAWAEDPPSRTNHLISNVIARHDGEGGFTVRTHFIVYRNRLMHEIDIYSGHRVDKVRQDENGNFKVYNRVIHFNANVLNAKNLSTFF